ncbi:FadR/GntR family transcriptional regulator [Phycicoccus sp. Root101]|uniref:FadR/GntR family transcriptional regulator n=1 Tax=Phycicoccus sp. Root101 TaxID=1736421 RepID=UPI0007026C92|nr:FadR/GntR family transcriptional regulator [Phycicoccus sp. Root101]KQU70174.1 hypothetical protein ASC58_20225 [Phycicoccus sp. Root101]
MIDWQHLAHEQRSAPTTISARIHELISDGDLVPGERIPAERELSTALGVSRATVREALRELELRGLIDRRRGRGTVVVESQRPEITSSLFGDIDPTTRALREVMDMRGVIEPPIAERAATRASTDQIERLADLVAQAADEIDRGVDPQRYVELDVAFHLTLARMTANPLLERLLTVTHEWMAPSRRSSLETETRIHRSLAAHRRILDAVQRHDPAAASREMTAHINDILTVIAGDGPTPTKAG